MLEASLSQLEQLVNDLVQQNQDLLSSNESSRPNWPTPRMRTTAGTELDGAGRKHGATAARIQALVQRVSAGPVSELNEGIKVVSILAEDYSIKAPAGKTKP